MPSKAIPKVDLAEGSKKRKRPSDEAPQEPREAGQAGPKSPPRSKPTPAKPSARAKVPVQLTGVVHVDGSPRGKGKVSVSSTDFPWDVLRVMTPSEFMETVLREKGELFDQMLAQALQASRMALACYDRVVADDAVLKLWLTEREKENKELKNQALTLRQQLREAKEEAERKLKEQKEEFDKKFDDANSKAYDEGVDAAIAELKGQVAEIEARFRREGVEQGFLAGYQRALAAANVPKENELWVSCPSPPEFVMPEEADEEEATPDAPLKDPEASKDPADPNAGKEQTDEKALQDAPAA